MVCYIVIGLFLLLAVLFERRAGRQTACWMAPFMVLGCRLCNLFNWPAPRLKAEPDRCIGCGRCTRDCPMSLDVNGMVESGSMENGECILCGSCVDGCPEQVIHYSFSQSR
jgi:ferredoxin-type protein NapH